MQDLIVARRTAKVKEERHDLFSSLLDANEEEAEGDVKLRDSELIGACCFSFCIYARCACVAGYVWRVSPRQSAGEGYEWGPRVRLTLFAYR